MKAINGVEFGNVEFIIKGKRIDGDIYDFGSLTIKCKDREFKLDTLGTYTNEMGDGNTLITLELGVDEELFNDCPFNITKQDLIDGNYSHDFSVELFFDGTFDNEIVSITFFVEIDGEDFQYNINQ